MKIPLETIRIGKQGKDQLLKLRRSTGIENWNVICRWAFCCSVKEKTVPPYFQHKLDDGVEMTWKIFAGEQSEIFAAFCWIRAKKDGFPMTTEGVANCFRAHLYRGLTFLSSGSKKKNISDLMIKWLDLKHE